MSFVSVKSDTGAVIPWEYHPAKAGAYKCGQMVGVSGGMIGPLAGGGTPPYLCMGETTIAADGDILPVLRVCAGDIFEAPLAAAGKVRLGDKLGVSAGGLEAGGSGTFEVVAADGDQKGDLVRGRFV